RPPVGSPSLRRRRCVRSPLLSLCSSSPRPPPPPRLPSFPTRRSSDLSLQRTMYLPLYLEKTYLQYLPKALYVLNHLNPDLIYTEDRKSTRLNSSHVSISYAVFCLKKKK